MIELNPPERNPRLGLPVLLFISLVPSILSQCVRLQQTTALGWILCDYSGRLGTLLVLAIIPVTRRIAFRKELIRISAIETALWVSVFVCLYPIVNYWINTVVNASVPGTRLQTYITPTGWLRLFDLTVGLALVAYHEEVFFRRCLWQVVNRYFTGFLGIFICSAAFALYHWTTGVGNMVAVFFLDSMPCFFTDGVGHYGL